LHSDPWAGAYGCWRTGLQGKWRPERQEEPDPETRRRRRERIEDERRARQEAEAQRQTQAAQEACEILRRLPDADDATPYLRRKGVKPCPGLKHDGDVLFIPIIDEQGAVASLQRIRPDGSKRFLSQGRVAGCFFPVKGNGGGICITEGLATALSVHMATGDTVLAAFSASNLEAVTRLARSRYPLREIIVVADNDVSTEQKTGTNPGAEAAKRAADAVSGRVVVPEIDGDVNDLHQKSGLDAVLQAFRGCDG